MNLVLTPFKADGDTDADEMRRVPQGRADRDGCRACRISSRSLGLGNCEARRGQTFETRLFRLRLCVGVGIHEKVGELAQEEGHHPSLLTECRTTVTWWTHKIKDLHRNDSH